MPTFVKTIISVVKRNIQRLICVGKQHEDGHRMANCNIPTESPVHLGAQSSQQTTLTWRGDGTGWEQSPLCGRLVFTRAEGLRRLASKLATSIIQDTYLACSEPEKLTIMLQRSYMLDPLRCIRPELSPAECRALLQQTAETLPPVLLEAVKKITGKMDSIGAEVDNSLFLAALGCGGRNYRRDCVICLTDEISCRHTEMVVFRPCGHSVCIEPCFQQLVSEHTGALPPKKIKTADGKKFTVVGKVDVTEASGFQCPICRATVQKTFQAEDVWLEGPLKPVVERYAAKLNRGGVSRKRIDEAEKELAKEAIEANERAAKLQEEHDAQKILDQQLLEEAQEAARSESPSQTLARRQMKHGGMWHPGRIPQVIGRQTLIIDRNWPLYHLLTMGGGETEQNKSQRLDWYFGSNTWSCCGQKHASPGCERCPHVGMLCCCGSDSSPVAKFVPAGMAEAPKAETLLFKN